MQAFAHILVNKVKDWKIIWPKIPKAKRAGRALFALRSCWGEILLSPPSSKVGDTEGSPVIETEMTSSKEEPLVSQ
jgi:hypothetical protein